MGEHIKRKRRQNKQNELLERRKRRKQKERVATNFGTVIDYSGAETSSDFDTSYETDTDADEQTAAKISTSKIITNSKIGLCKKGIAALANPHVDDRRRLVSRSIAERLRASEDAFYR